MNKPKRNLGFVLSYIKMIRDHSEKAPKNIYLNPERYDALLKELTFKTDPVRLQGVEILKDFKLPPGKDRYTIN